MYVITIAPWSKFFKCFLNSTFSLNFGCFSSTCVCNTFNYDRTSLTFMCVNSIYITIVKINKLYIIIIIWQKIISTGSSKITYKSYFKCIYTSILLLKSEQNLLINAFTQMYIYISHTFCSLLLTERVLFLSALVFLLFTLPTASRFFVVLSILEPLENIALSVKKLFLVKKGDLLTLSKKRWTISFHI